MNQEREAKQLQIIGIEQPQTITMATSLHSMPLYIAYLYISRKMPMENTYQIYM